MSRFNFFNKIKNKKKLEDKFVEERKSNAGEKHFTTNKPIKKFEKKPTNQHNNNHNKPNISGKNIKPKIPNVSNNHSTNNKSVVKKPTSKPVFTKNKQTQSPKVNTNNKS